MVGILNQTAHMLIERRQHSSILVVRSFRGADCDTDDCLMVAKVREGLAVSKQAAQKFDGERFNLNWSLGNSIRLGYKQVYSFGELK